MTESAAMPRIVVSMTTIPSRIEFIRPVLEAVLNQTVPVDYVEMNIPHVSKRFGTPYDLPTWLASMDRVRIFRTEDYGPITKIAPTLLRYEYDTETYLWSVDDDCAYPPNQLELLCHVHDPDKRRILTRYGGKLNNDGTVNFWYGQGEVTMLEGFGGVLYPPGCIREDFANFLEVTSANSDCRKNDDIVLAMYFAHIGVTMYLYNQPTEETPYMVQGWLPHGANDPLRGGKNYDETYKKIFAFVRSIL